MEQGDNDFLVTFIYDTNIFTFDFYHLGSPKIIKKVKKRGLLKNQGNQNYDL